MMVWRSRDKNERASAIRSSLAGGGPPAQPSGAPDPFSLGRSCRRRVHPRRDLALRARFVDGAGEKSYAVVDLVGRTEPLPGPLSAPSWPRTLLPRGPVS